MISIVGKEYLKENTETAEFSYKKEYNNKRLEFIPINFEGRDFQRVDIRFVKGNVTVLIETKANFDVDKTAEVQLSAYVEYEKRLTGNNVIAILANTNDDRIKVWKGNVKPENFLEDETHLRTMNEYVDFYHHRVNDKEKVMQNTYSLNELLHAYGVSESLRSQFVGTCLLALKNNLEYKTPTINASQIRAGIKEILGTLLTDDISKTTKLSLLNNNVLESQDIRDLNDDALRDILSNIEQNILPFINDRSTAGQDLLNLFFITFNKYIGKKDKNQAFTPDHITDFMSKLTLVNKNSVVMDPCCGSGSFLVRAMTQAIDDCNTADEENRIKKNQIFGIEYNEIAFGLSTTNMLIHGDGNSNIIQGSCFEHENWIINARPNIILMNPPYNAQSKHLPDEYTDTWSDSTSRDPSKGFYFVKYITDLLNENRIKATIAVLLPVSCAIGTSNEIKKLKKAILIENRLDAVFTLPNEVFYPGASVSACCMVFETGKPHSSGGDTFFGYYKNDGFKKRKNLGRVEQMDNITEKSKWEEIEKTWLDLYFNRKSVEGISVTHKVTGTDEWLCEAYMKTDYTKLSQDDFQRTVNDYLSFLIKKGDFL